MVATQEASPVASEDANVADTKEVQKNEEPKAETPEVETKDEPEANTPAEEESNAVPTESEEPTEEQEEPAEDAAPEGDAPLEGDSSDSEGHSAVADTAAASSGDLDGDNSGGDSEASGDDTLVGIDLSDLSLEFPTSGITTCVQIRKFDRKLQSLLFSLSESSYDEVKRTLGTLVLRAVHRMETTK